MTHNFLVLTVLLFLLSVIAGLLYARKRRAGLLDPITVFLIFYAVFVVPLPLRSCFTLTPQGDVSDQLPRFLPYMPFALLLCSIGIPFFLWAYYSRAARWLGRKLPAPNSPGEIHSVAPLVINSVDRTRVFVLLICGLSLFLISRLSGGDILEFVLLGYNSTAEMFGRGYLAAGFPWFFVGSMFLLYRYACFRAKLDLLLFAVLVAMQISAFAVLGDRHSILNIVLATLTFWNFAVKKVRVARLAISAITGLLLLSYMSNIRGSDYSSLYDFVSRTNESVSTYGKTDLASSLATGGLAAPFEIMPQVIRKYWDQPQLGRTYFRDMAQAVPSPLWLHRPVGLTSWYMETFYGSGWGMNQGRAFFFLAEGYLNFGPIGVFLTMLFWGLFLGTVQNYRQANPENPGAILVYALIVSWIVRCVAGDMASLAVGLPEQELGVALLGLWICGSPRLHSSSKTPPALFPAPVL